jgi:hypothetical protein
MVQSSSEILNCLKKVKARFVCYADERVRHAFAVGYFIREISRRPQNRSGDLANITRLETAVSSSTLKKG